MLGIDEMRGAQFLHLSDGLRVGSGLPTIPP